MAGWAGFRLKEKLKLIKSDLKEWNKTMFGYLDFQIDMRRSKIEVLDRLDEVFGLEDGEVIERNRVTADLMRYLS